MKIEEMSLEELVTEFLCLLNKVETSDSGTDFRPNQISSCRVMDSLKIDKILVAMEQATQFKRSA